MNRRNPRRHARNSRRKAAAAVLASEKVADPGAALHAILRDDPGSFVYDDFAVRKLLKSHPEAARNCGLPDVIYRAIKLRASATTIRLLGDACPDSVRFREATNGTTPLHAACCGAKLDVVRVLIDLWPEALGEKDNDGAIATPLHVACFFPASLKVVTLLADRYPKALEMKTVMGCTPLHLACDQGATLGVVKLLVERYPEALWKQEENGMTPLQRANESGKSSGQVIKLLTTLRSLHSLTDNDPQIMDMIRRFQETSWPGGVGIVLNAFPSAANKMDYKLMPAVLSLVGRRCNLNTFYMMLQDNPTLVKGAVKKGKRSKKPPAKKARTE